MRWNSFNLISPAIDRTKKRLFPFSFWEWFKLAIISALAGGRGGNFNFSNYGGNSSNSNSKSFGDFSNGLRDAIKKYWVFGAFIFLIGFALITLFSYIQSVFSFIFIESLINEKAKFTFRKNNSKGVSLFLFKFTISIIVLIVIGLLSFPYVYNFMQGNPIINSVGWGYIIFSIFAFVLFLIALWILFLFFYDFAVPYMYLKNTPAFFSLKQVWKEIRQKKLETFVYWVSRLVLGIAIALIGVIVAIILLLALVIVGALIALLGYGLYLLIGGAVFFIILGIIFAIILGIVFLLILVIILLPLGVFSKYFALLNFEELTKLKILKK